MVHRWFPKLERLTARLVVGITALVIIPLSAGLFLLSRFEYEHTVAARRTAAELETRILETALRHQMLRRDPQLMAEIFREVGRQPEVRWAIVSDPAPCSTWARCQRTSSGVSGSSDASRRTSAGMTRRPAE